MKKEMNTKVEEINSEKTKKKRNKRNSQTSTKDADNEKIVEYIIYKYNKELAISEKYNIPIDGQSYDFVYIRIVNDALNRLDEESRIIIRNEFIDSEVERYWFLRFYSRSAFYRRRIIAIERFLDLL